MSRSRRSTPITGMILAFSEKEDKRRANRHLRSRIRQILHVTATGNHDPDNLSLPLLRELSNVWCFDKDGKVYNFADSWRMPHGMRK